MSHIQSAFYARVSSDAQAKSHTIDSQVAAILERAALDGCSIPMEFRFVDEGFSGSTLARPALERLRDLAAGGRIDRVYVHSPDRLARELAHQIILTEEFQRDGVELLFLNRSLGNTPEDAMLLQMQGVMAQFERAKFLERTRRGRRYAARAALVSAMTAVPYGYRYTTKQEGGGVARVDAVPQQAEVVRQIFQWVACDRCSLWEVRRRLENLGIPSPKGHPAWCSATLHALLSNPAYIGKAAFGRTRSIQWLKPLRPHRGTLEYPHAPDKRSKVPEEEWLSLPYPALIDPELFALVAVQLKGNQERMRVRRNGASSLLQGLLECMQCHYAFVRHTSRCGKGPNGEGRTYAYYQCIGKHPAHGDKVTGPVDCQNRTIPVEFLDEAVWCETKAMLKDPGRVEEEYLRRLQHAETCAQTDLSPVRREEHRLRSSLSRLIDGYAEGLVEKSEFEPRAQAMRHRLAQLQVQEKEVLQVVEARKEIRFLVGQLDTFASRIHDGLDNADWQTKRDLITTLVKRVEISPETITVVFRVGEPPLPGSSLDKITPHCSNGDGRG